MKDEALRLALEALEWNMDYLPSQGHGTSMASKAITALQEALAQPQQEPVAIVAVDGIGQIQVGWLKKPQHNDKLYTSPPAQRKPLTDGLDVKRLNHCVIAVRDWLGGGCDTNDIPRPEIATLGAFTNYGIKE